MNDAAKYFELMTDNDDLSAWELELDWELPNGEWKDVWKFTKGKRLFEDSPIEVRISEVGHHVDFNVANFSIPIVSKRFADLIADLAPDDIQRISVAIDGNNDWEILNVLHCLPCIDFDRSVIDYGRGDSSSSDLAEIGPKPKGIRLLIIDPAKARNRNVLRVENWRVPIIVSKNIKEAIEESGFTGFQTKQVS